MSGLETLDAIERTLGCGVSSLSALVLISDGGSSGDVTTMEGNEVGGLLGLLSAAV